MANTLILTGDSDFWLPKLQENKFLLLSATQFVAICGFTCFNCLRVSRPRDNQLRKPRRGIYSLERTCARPVLQHETSIVLRQEG